METDGQRAAVLDALGDRTRRAIVDLLVEGPRAVAELAEELPVGRPAVSLHLKVLREAGLVKHKAVGTRRVYSIDPTGLEVLRTYLDRVWQSALANWDDLDHSSLPSLSRHRRWRTGCHPGNRRLG